MQVRMKEGGRAASSDELLAMMRGFKDNVTLDHLYRDQVLPAVQAHRTVAVAEPPAAALAAAAALCSAACASAMAF